MNKASPPDSKMSRKSGKSFSWKEAFDQSFFIFAGLAIVTGTLAYLKFGAEAFEVSFHEDLSLIAFLVPKLGAALLIAGFVQVLLPPAFLGRYMGKQSGVKGMAIATLAGAATPGGPMTAFPLVTVLRNGGTGLGALVTYVTAWTTMGLQRVFMWEVPLMGIEFAVVRFLASLPLPLIAGLLTLWARDPDDAPADSIGASPGREDQ
ncbi:putative permease [Hartmannibacter diazotrophicus]|uniref:Putative permease n=1 Tax=Hartmannibacter diazotrophicus TaxID=1482074 RepID=A0A2C9DBY5_9HYPH|nr:permease [Hartmannibacter diazotrophicus]SON57776.1 putative permease [Hartmannibacter diazotrophicus]